MAWKDSFSGNLMFTDGYRMREIHEGMVMEVKAKDGVTIAR